LAPLVLTGVQVVKSNRLPFEAERRSSLTLRGEAVMGYLGTGNPCSSNSSR
jgi:hypothetical protein